jgi:hypothetical protein
VLTRSLDEAPLDPAELLLGISTASPELEGNTVGWVRSRVEAVVGAEQLRHVVRTDVEGVGGRSRAGAEDHRSAVRRCARGGKTAVVAVHILDLSRGLSWGRSRGTGRGRGGR